MAVIANDRDNILQTRGDNRIMSPLVAMIATSTNPANSISGFNYDTATNTYTLPDSITLTTSITGVGNYTLPTYKWEYSTSLAPAAWASIASTASSITITKAAYKAIIDANPGTTFITYRVTISQSGWLDSYAVISLAKNLSTSGDSIDIIFVRSATTPATPNPSIGAPSTPIQWYTDVATANAIGGLTIPLWFSTGSKTAGAGNYTWDTPAKTSGSSAAEVTVYTRSSTTPTTPTGGTYTFTNPPVFVAPISWNSSVPSGSLPIYISKAVVSTTSDNLAAVPISGWSAPILSMSNGSSYTLSIDGGVRNVTFDATGGSPVPVQSAFTCNLKEDGVTKTPVSYSWSAGGHLSGTSTSSSFTPTCATTFNASLNDFVSLTVTYTNQIGSTVTVSQTTSIAVTKIGNTGTPGNNGTSTYAATVYKQQPSDPGPTGPAANTSSYNFTTGVLTPPTGWLASQPASSTTPTWACDYIFVGTAGSNVVGIGNWSNTYIEAQNGSPGNNGEYRDTIQLYLQSASVPTQPTSIQYAFSTNSIGTQVGGTAGWSMTQPAASTVPTYITKCLATSTTPTIAVTLSSWSAPVVTAQNGSPGVSITGVAELYQKHNNGTTAPTGTWSASIPTLDTTNKYLWTQETISYSNSTSTIIHKLIGTMGDNGRGISSVANDYQISSNATTAPTGIWSTSIPTLDNTNRYMWNRETITYTDSSTSIFYYMIGTKGIDGSNGTNGSNGSNGSNGTNGTKTYLANCYIWATSQPNAPSWGFTLTWPTAISSVPTGYSVSPPASPGSGYTLFMLTVQVTADALATSTPADWSTGSWGFIGYRLDGSIGPVGPIGPQGTTGQAARRAYKVTSSQTSPTSVTGTTGDFPPIGDSNDTVDWSYTVSNPGTNQWLHQVDGLYTAGGNVAWGAPYLASFRVGSLSALSANMGTITGGTITTTGFILGTGASSASQSSQNAIGGLSNITASGVFNVGADGSSAGSATVGAVGKTSATVGVGLYGESNASSDTAGVFGYGFHGVIGRTPYTNGVGIVGQHAGTGTGVRGDATTASGTGVHANGSITGSRALYASGGGAYSQFDHYLTTSAYYKSTVATGTQPIQVSSTTMCNNLNVNFLQGKTWEAPGAIGGTTPSSGKFSGSLTLEVADIRIKSTADATGIGAIIRNDGANLYLLHTAAADANGSWTADRPLMYNFSTKNLSLNKVILTGMPSSLGPSTGAATYQSLPDGTSRWSVWLTISWNGTNYYIPAFAV